MVNFLVWNLKKQDLAKQVAALAAHHHSDVILCVECRLTRLSMTRALIYATGVPFHAVATQTKSFGVYSRFAASCFVQVPPIESVPKYELWRFKPPDQEDILLALIHGPDKWTSNASDQEEYFQKVSRELKTREYSLRNDRVLLTGDFNVNPFERAVCSRTALKSVMCKEIIERQRRTVGGEKPHYFYNPMWDLLGNRAPKRPGTYYHSTPHADDPYWHMLDQVILREGLFDRFDEESLAILDSAGKTNLLTRHRLPNMHDYSDHLPIKFSVDLRLTEARDV